MKQIPEFKKEFQKVIKAVQIKEVSLVSNNCVCHCHHSFIEPKYTLLDLKKKIDTDYFTKENKGTIFSKVDLKLEGISQKEGINIKKNDSLFTISVSYMVIYDVNDMNLNPQAVKYFGQENAYFNVYPYLREFITTMSQRMNLPSPLVLPLLKPKTQIIRKQKDNS